MASEGNISCANDSNGPSEDQELKQVKDKMGLSMKQHENTDIHMVLSGGCKKNVSPALDVSIQPLNKNDLFGNDHLSNVMEPSSTSERLEVDPDKTAGNKTKVQSSNSITVLEKSLGSTLSLDSPDSSMALEVIILAYCYFELAFQNFLVIYFGHFLAGITLLFLVLIWQRCWLKTYS